MQVCRLFLEDIRLFYNILRPLLKGKNSLTTKFLLVAKILNLSSLLTTNIKYINVIILNLFIRGKYPEYIDKSCL